MLGKGLESLIPKKQVSDLPTTADDNQGGGNGYITEHKHLNQLEPKEKIAESLVSSREAVSKPHPFKTEAIFHIEIEKIKPNPYQPRRDFHEEELAELAQSIREFGIIQPLIVTKIERETITGTEVEYQLIAGERRLMAAKLLSLERIPVIIRRALTNHDKLEIALIENIQRSNLNPLETARAYSRLQDEFGLTQREISARVGKSRETIANTMRLLNLPSHIQQAIAENKLSESQARALLSINNPEEQNRVFQNILLNRTSGRIVHEEAMKTQTLDPENQYWQKRLEETIGAPVRILRRDGRGKMVIQFHSDEEWQNILSKLLGDETD